MNIHLRFEPDVERARQIDRRMNTELASSLCHVVEQARGQLPFDAGAILSLADALVAGARVAPDTFARYYELVSALMDGKADESVRLLSQIAAATPMRKERRFTLLRDPAVCDLSDLYLKKFLDDDNSGTVRPPPSEVAVRFVDRFERGMTLMRAVAPELAGEVDAIVHDVVPVVGVPGARFQIDGGSHYQLWGALFLNADFHPTDEAMVEVIAHESAHSLLFGFTTDTTLLTNDDDEFYQSPLRPDPRPMNGIYHATFVSARMHWVMDRLLDSDALAPERRDQVRRARDLDRENFRAGIETVREHARLTDLGAEIMAGAEQYMATV